MKRWLKFLPHNKYRRLQLAPGGKWFIALAILLGLVAINSANNVIYLLESLLLSTLLFSGILSEQTLARLKVSRTEGEARAGQRSRDTYFLQNKGRIPLFCLEVGEWRDGEFYSHGFLFFLPAMGSFNLCSQENFTQRGKRSWDHLAVATSFPFGFARKVRLLADGGTRIVWPAEKNGTVKLIAEVQNRGFMTEFSPGEVQEIAFGEDLTRVHWPSTARAGKFMARTRKSITEENEIFFEIEPPGPQLEEKIMAAASALYRTREPVSLYLHENDKKIKIRGKVSALNALALMPMEQP